MLRLTPFLGLAIKATSLGRIAETLVETYLGRDAGRRVLSGRIARGVADRIKTVLWFSDLRNYTRISDTAPPEQIIPLLNDYAEAIVSAIHQNSGDVLKLIGDGVLAIFPAEDRARACAAALDAAKEAREAVEALHKRRLAEGLPATDMYLGLHLGVVFYGNIGSKERLDFTIVGPAVNEVARIAAMCRSVDQPILIGRCSRLRSPRSGARFSSVGRFYSLRGGAQDLFHAPYGASQPPAAPLRGLRPVGYGRETEPLRPRSSPSSASPNSSVALRSGGRLLTMFAWRDRGALGPERRRQDDDDQHDLGVLEPVVGPENAVVDVMVVDRDCCLNRQMRPDRARNPVSISEAGG